MFCTANSVCLVKMMIFAELFKINYSTGFTKNQ